MPENKKYNIEKNKCIALIPARGGSKSVPKKNIRIFQGHPMIAYSIAIAKLSERIDRVIVSTDSEEIAKVAKEYGAEVPFIRPEEYAQDDSPDIDFVKHAILWFHENEESIPEYIVHLRPTTPIRAATEVSRAIELISKDEKATSLRSVHLLAHSPYKWFKESTSGYLSALMPGMTCDETNKPRQTFPKIYVPNGYVDILKTEFILENNLLHGERMVGFLTDEIPDIDTEMDIFRLETFKPFERNLKEILYYLEQCII